MKDDREKCNFLFIFRRLWRRTFFARKVYAMLVFADLVFAIITSHMARVDDFSVFRLLPVFGFHIASVSVRVYVYSSVLICFSVRLDNGWDKRVHLMHVHARPKQPHAEHTHECEAPSQSASWKNKVSGVLGGLGLITYCLLAPDAERSLLVKAAYSPMSRANTMKIPMKK